MLLMLRKRALVVDDSKSARVILSRMLEKYDIEVDMAESAEQAIDYLKNSRPDAIFMDHLMPGMDGFEAVQAIKGNPQTATIPIMMYTSQEGELYVGQARALGAMGVLPKQVRPVDVSKVLYELHLLPDRRDTEEPDAHRPEVMRVDADHPVTPASLRPGVSPLAGIVPVVTPEWGRRLESTLKEQTADLRRFVVASFDSFSSRIVSDMRMVVHTPVSEVVAPMPPPAKWPWLVGIAAIGTLAVLAGSLWWLTRDELAKSRVEIAGLAATNAQLQRSRDDLATTVKDLTTAVASLQAAPSAGNSMSGGGAARAESVPYGELPFDRSRLDVFRDLLSKLEAKGYKGVVKMTSMAGIFCLSGNSLDGYVPANPNSLASKCDLVGNPFEESLSAQQRQSLAFANLASSVRQRTSGRLTVVVENATSPRAPVSYPPRSESLTAGEWNRVAAANNRVEFVTEPTALQFSTAPSAPVAAR